MKEPDLGLSVVEKELRIANFQVVTLWEILMLKPISVRHEAIGLGFGSTTQTTEFRQQAVGARYIYGL